MGSRIRRVGLLAAVVGLAVHAFRYDFISDDAFIVARYARNILDGHGFVYNIGDRVEGYTSILSLLVTAGLGGLGLDLVTAVRALSLAGALASVMLIVRLTPLLGLPPNHPLVGVAPVICAASSTFACWALGGLETTVYAAIILAVGYAIGRPDARSTPMLAATGALVALCVLTRPEGVLVGVAVALTLLRTDPRRARRDLVVLAIPALLIVGGHLIWRYAYYGFLLPNTFYAKVGTTTAQAFRGVGYVLGFLQDNGTAALWVTPFLVVPLLHRSRLAIYLGLVGLLLTTGVILVGGDGLAMYRFMTPLVPVWALLLVRLLVDVAQRLQDRLGPHLTWVSYGVPWAITIAAAVAVATPPTGLSQFDLYAYQREVEVPRWRAAGEWLGANSPAGASVAAVPIGAVGYYSGLRLYDMVGLTDTHIAHRSVPLGTGWPGHEKHDGPYILSRQPTYLLLGNVRVLDEPLAFDDPTFIRPDSPPIRDREDDIFGTELDASYVPRRVELPGGLHFHFLQRRELP